MTNVIKSEEMVLKCRVGGKFFIGRLTRQDNGIWVADEYHERGLCTVPTYRTFSEAMNVLYKTEQVVYPDYTIFDDDLPF